ncbi:MAG TPA: hypothetical protein PKK31_06660 [Elusimicrobiales bacterium]|nr:hypothetical protein [Elusimicrobiales bacterium]
MKSYPDAEREIAREARLAEEIELSKSHKDYEVVLLEASSEDSLRKTHSRYFLNVEQIGGTMGSSVVKKDDPAR